MDDPYTLNVPPNYDHLIGRAFENALPQARSVYKKIRETETVEELERRRGDGCILVFGVRKADDVILYWRVDSGPGTCYVRKKPLNV